MARFTPLRKLSKKAQKEHNRKKRTLWSMSPVTRRVESKKLYSRKRKAHDRFDDDRGTGFFLFPV